MVDRNFGDIDLEHHREKKLDLHWNIILIQDLELWEFLEILLIADQMDDFLKRYRIRVHQGRWEWISTNHNGCGCSGSGSISCALFLPDMLDVDQEDVREVSYVDIINYHEVSVRVTHVDLRIFNI